MTDGASGLPRVFQLDGASLQAARGLVYDGDPDLAAADQRLLQDAGAARAVGPFSVVSKTCLPPSGDAHDYLSQGPYWWPDPDTEDGLPWVRRDGEANPDREVHDRHALAAMMSAVNTLSAAYYFTDHEDFAECAGLLLRTWFLDPQTRMNPHLQYAQGIPGRCDGRGIGIIDTAQIGFLVDSVSLLGESTAWTDSDQRLLTDWMSQFLEWLTGSAYGLEEKGQPNNHGTWYDVQVLSLALSTGRRDVAQDVADRATRRLESQIEPDGTQPLELARTRSLGYSVMNLTGLFDLADLCTHCDVDLWRHEGDGARSLRVALQWLVENAIDSAWIRPQIEPFDTAWWLPLLRRASQRFQDPAFAGRISRLPGLEDEAAERTHLLYHELAP